MNLVNHGTEVVWRTAKYLSGSHTTAEHVGFTGHDDLAPGEQCKCGQLGIGIIRVAPEENQP